MSINYGFNMASQAMLSAEITSISFGDFIALPRRFVVIVNNYRDRDFFGIGNIDSPMGYRGAM
jgi:hypothetical protein